MRRSTKSKNKKIVIVEEIVEVELVQSEEEISALQRVANSPLRQILLTGTFIKFPKSIHKVLELNDVDAA